MKHATPVILVLAAMTCSISTAALNANHVFDGRIWIAWCGYGVTGALLLIAALIAVLNSKREKEKESLPPPPPSPHNTQQVNQQANPVQTVYVGKEYAPSTAPEPPAAKLEANIHFVETKTIDVLIGEDDVFDETVQDLRDFRVMVACFRNDAIAEQRVQQPIVKAHIIYKDVHGREITDVSNGVWLNEYKGETTFTIGEKRSLILFHFGRQGMLITPWKESYTHAQSWMNDGLPSLRIRDRAITGDIDRIEIRVLSESSGSCIKQIVLKAEVRLNEFPTLTPDPTSSAG